MGVAKSVTVTLADLKTVIYYGKSKKKLPKSAKDNWNVRCFFKPTEECWRCRLCGGGFDNPRKVVSHVVMKHTGAKEYADYFYLLSLGKRKKDNEIFIGEVKR